MIEINKKEDCYGCNACINICPKKCIEMKNDIEGFYYPKVNIAQCINCNLCNQVCPTNTHYKQKETFNVETYACYNLNEKIRLQSSSGGIFSIIAEQILNENGIVVGAAFDENFGVHHICINSINELDLLRRSKYVQSNMNDIYIQIEKYLNQNKKVLFSGTPCQVQAIYSYFNTLKINIENLFCIDLFCHGVPSDSLWKDYIKYRENIANSKTKSISFRDKSDGWNNFSVYFQFENNLMYCKSNTEDLYMQGFLRNVFFRPSCYSCQFKGINRSSDITLADLWGIKNISPELDDDKGCSVIMVNSKKGLYLFNLIQKNIYYKEIDLEKVIYYNSGAISPSIYSERKDMFYNNYYEKHLSFDKSISSCVGKDVGIGRLRQYFKLFNKWIYNLQENIYIYQILENMNIKTVALWGWGDIGKHLYLELSQPQSKIKVSYVTENIPVNTNNLVKEVLLTEVKLQEKVDAIIICSYASFYEAKAYLIQNGFEGNIISLKDLIFNLNF